MRDRKQAIQTVANELRAAFSFSPEAVAERVIDTYETLPDPELERLRKMQYGIEALIRQDHLTMRIEANKRIEVAQQRNREQMIEAVLTEWGPDWRDMAESAVDTILALPDPNPELEHWKKEWDELWGKFQDQYEELKRLRTIGQRVFDTYCTVRDKERGAEWSKVDVEMVTLRETLSEAGEDK